MARQPPVISCLTSCYGRFGAEAAIRHVREAGLGWIELPIRTAGFASRAGDPPLLTDEATAAQVEEVRQLLAREGVAVASINAISGNPLKPDVVRIIRRKLEIAAALGVRKIVIDAGSHETDDERMTLLSHLTEIAEQAHRLGQLVCCETHRGVCQDHRAMLELMKAVEHPALRLNFDTANILYYNENAVGEVALAKVCQYVKAVHLKDSMGKFGQWYFPALGEGGAVDFVRVLDIMRGIRFQGPYTIEIGGIEGEGELTLAQYHDRVQRSVKYLRSIGYFDAR
jgi:L-ribulose-5-phosphate 3-epimerase